MWTALVVLIVLFASVLTMLPRMVLDDAPLIVLALIEPALTPRWEF